MGRALTLLFPITSQGVGSAMCQDKIRLQYCDQSFLDIFAEVEEKSGIDCPLDGISVHNVKGHNKIKESVLMDAGRVKSILVKDLKPALKKYPKHKLDWEFKAVIAFISHHPGNWPIYLYWN